MTVPASTPSPRVIVIGTGFAGLCMAIRLQQSGVDSLVVLEKAPSLGGTWRDNDYPGAACDVQSHLYSFSFEQNARWSRMYAPQKEIRGYLDRTADKYDVRRHIRFGAEVTDARFDEQTNTWTVTLAGGETLEADYVVTATGGLSRPSYPDIVGLSTFEGKLFHSARWDHDFDLGGKTVGVIGTGASSIQFVPQIAEKVNRLHLFQRTPPWILPKPDRSIPRAEQWIYAIVPWFQWLYRVFLYWMLELRVLGFAIDPKLMKFPQHAAAKFLETSVHDPALREKLTPKYTIGCKRILMSNDYYPAVCRENVDVIDTGIAEITADSVVTKDGTRRRVDALILGTGFQASESVSPFPIRGRSGVLLADEWRDGAEAYLGTTVAGFPNLFMLVGPNTGLGHSSMVFMIESQVEHVMRALAAAKSHAASAIEVRRTVQRAFNVKLHAKLDRSVWASGCASWYRTRSGKNTTLWPGFTFVFRRLTRRLVDERAFQFSGPSVAPAERARAALHAGTPASLSS